MDNKDKNNCCYNKSKTDRKCCSSRRVARNQQNVSNESFSDFPSMTVSSIGHQGEINLSYTNDTNVNNANNEYTYSTNATANTSYNVPADEECNNSYAKYSSSPVAGTQDLIYSPEETYTTNGSDSNCLLLYPRYVPTPTPIDSNYSPGSHYYNTDMEYNLPHSPRRSSIPISENRYNISFQSYTPRISKDQRSYRDQTSSWSKSQKQHISTSSGYNNKSRNTDCCMSMPTCCKSNAKLPPNGTKSALNGSFKFSKINEEKLMEARQDSINMLSVVISTVMLLAVEMPNIPPKFLYWTNRYLSCIKNLQGQRPENVKKILDMIQNMKVSTPEEILITPQKSSAISNSTEYYDSCACPQKSRNTTTPSGNR